MNTMIFVTGDLDERLQASITEGLEAHTESFEAPAYRKERVNWLLKDDEGNLQAALTGDNLWDWLYVDELWVADSLRGGGIGSKLLAEAESYCTENGLIGLWLWTQSWQAEGFYKRCGFEEFTRFPDFPKGHTRIGFRKFIAA